MCLVMVGGLTSCKGRRGNGGDNTDEAAIPAGSIAVPFSTEDSMNPFFMTSVMNSTLVSLVFQSLYYLDAGYDNVRELAVSETVSTGSVKVELSHDFLFSDSTPVTEDDVIYSFELAKASKLYSTLLEGIESCTAAEEGFLMFSLAYPDVNVLNALSFPIVKRGTATTETSAPVGSGPFRFNQDGIRTSLICNLLYKGDLPPVGTIRLTSVSRDATLETLVDTGELDFCYSDLSSGNAKRTYSPVSYIYLNNLVFVGLNSNTVNLRSSAIRRGIACAFDRQEIVKSAFQGFARAATVPFNTSWTQMTSSAAASKLSFYSDETKAKELFKTLDAGVEENVMYLTLICPDTNSFMRNTAKLIAKQLSAYYIDVNVKFLDETAYIYALQTGDYDMYVGEIKIPKTMDLSAFFAYDGAASYGIDTTSGASASAYFKYREGDTGIEEFLNVFLNEMPFIPLCFRNGRMCYTPDITYTAGAADGRIFADISGWKITLKEE